MAVTVEAPTQPAPTKPLAPAATNWFANPLNRYLALGGGALVVVLIVWFVNLSGARKETFGAQALEKARSSAESGNFAQAASELQTVITTYRGTRAAEEAVITLNQVRLVNGQHELAVVGLQEFLKSGPSEAFLAPANGLLGRALENAKRPGEAAAAYLEASRTADVDYLKASFLLDAARTQLEAGERDKAIATYRDLLKTYPETNSRTEAEIRLAELTGGQM